MDQSQAPIEVEADLFSGRPNPRWTMADESAAQFQALLGSLVSSPPRELEGGLGFRGFIVRMPEPGSARTGRRVTVLKETVVVETPTARHYFADPGAQCEKWLVNTAKGRIPDDLFQWLVEATR